MNTTIKVTIKSTDGFRQTRTFKSVAAAQKYAQKWVGELPDVGMGYAVSSYGTTTVSVDGARIQDLFPGTSLSKEEDVAQKRDSAIDMDDTIMDMGQEVLVRVDGMDLLVFGMFDFPELLREFSPVWDPDQEATVVSVMHTMGVWKRIKSSLPPGTKVRGIRNGVEKLVTL